jgi:hypothetical protein
MAHTPLLATISAIIQSVMTFLCPFTGFRCGPWHPPMAHMLLLAMLFAMLPGLLLHVIICPHFLTAQGLFAGFRCRPHLRV